MSTQVLYIEKKCTNTKLSFCHHFASLALNSLLKLSKQSDNNRPHHPKPPKPPIIIIDDSDLLFTMAQAMFEALSMYEAIQYSWVGTTIVLILEINKLRM